jgi:hypothetical protein
VGNVGSTIIHCSFAIIILMNLPFVLIDRSTLEA